MAILTPTYDANDCRSNVATSITAAANGDTIRFRSAANGGGDAWNFKGFTEAGVELTTNASGAIEVTKNLILSLDAGVTLQESSVTPFTASGGTPSYQCLIRFKGVSNCGITFGAGSKLLGQKGSHTGDASEFMCGAKFIGCTGVTITGTGELHFDGFYGDGLWFASGNYTSQPANTSVVVNDVWAANNARSGITCEDCVGTFNNPKVTANFGKAPQVGMNMETDNSSDTLQVVVNNGYAEGRSHGFLVQIADVLTPAIQITLNNCRSVKSALAGDDPWGFDFSITAASTPAGSYIKANNCEAINLKSAGIRFGATGTYPIGTNLAVTLTNCIIDNCSTLNLDKPLSMAFSGAPGGGGISFVDCRVYDRTDRKCTEITSSGGDATNVTGNIILDNAGQYYTTSQAQALHSNLTPVRGILPVRLRKRSRTQVRVNRGGSMGGGRKRVSRGSRRR